MKKDYIFDVIKNSPNSLTAEEIYNNVSQNININLSTVYRTLNNLVDKDLVTKIVRQDKIVLVLIVCKLIIAYLILSYNFCD